MTKPSEWERPAFAYAPTNARVCPGCASVVVDAEKHAEVCPVLREEEAARRYVERVGPDFSPENVTLDFIRALGGSDDDA